LNQFVESVILKFLFLSFLQFSLFQGCAHFQENNFNTFPAFKPEVVLYNHNRNIQKIKSLKAESTAKIETKRGGALVVKMLIYCDKAQKFRIENTTPFGHPISSIVLKNSRIKFHDIKGNTLIISDGNPEHMNKLIQIPLSAVELASLITLRIPVNIKTNTFYYKDKKFYFSPERSRFNTGFLTFNSEEFPDSMNLSNEKDHLNISYLNYKKHGGIFFPEKFIIKTASALITLHVKKIFFCNKISPDIFKLHTEEDVEKIYLE